MPSAATTPAAGPDSSASTGRCAASSEVITPPEDCMIVSGASTPAPSRPLPDVGDVAAHQRPHVGVDDGRRRALVLALLAQDLARERDGDAGQLLAQDRADRLLVLREAVASGAGRRRPTRRRPRAGAPRARAPRPRRAGAAPCRRRSSARETSKRSRRGTSGSGLRQKGRTCGGCAGGAARARRGTRRSSRARSSRRAARARRSSRPSCRARRPSTARAAAASAATASTTAVS